MAKKSRGSSRKTQENLIEKTMNSGHQFFLAGIGAAAKLAEGPKLFKSLVEEGAAVESRTGKSIEAGVEQSKAKISAREDTLEQALEERICRVLHRSGIPTNNDIQELFKQMEELRNNVKALIAARTGRVNTQDDSFSSSLPTDQAETAIAIREPTDLVPKGGSKL